SQKIVTVDKKYFNLPDKFQLTLNGPVKKEVFGYLPYWMIDNLNDIDTRLITSISYFGLDVDGEGNITDKTQSDSYNPYNIWQNDKNLDNFFKKMKVNKTKIFLTFKSFNNDNISKLLLSQEASQRFLNNILYQVDSHNLDGVNIDFEYTGVPSENIRNKFSVLISTLNDYLKNRNSKTLLNISVYATAATITQLWDIPYLAYHSDSIIVMGYDFFTPQSGSAGPIAPISGYSNSISGIVNNFLDSMPSEKIILAVPYYGYDWTTINQSENAEVKPNTEVKTLSYAESNDITKNIKTNWDEESQTPWYSFVDASGASHVVHFENLRSIGVKYDIVNNKNLAGAAIWALGLDGNDTRLTQLLIDKFTK
ncbi:MAG: glycosyl hydrolase family 18 protein, partial [Actinobacteria bacterium]|nr:glycosyl hydrolase family 18 protein [Actinomycetota bacterium]